VHFRASFETQQLPDIRFREPLCTVSFERNRFEYRTCGLLAIGEKQAPKYIRQLDGNSHGSSSLPLPIASVNPIPPIATENSDRPMTSLMGLKDVATIASQPCIIAHSGP